MIFGSTTFLMEMSFYTLNASVEHKQISIYALHALSADGANNKQPYLILSIKQILKTTCFVELIHNYS